MPPILPVPAIIKTIAKVAVAAPVVYVAAKAVGGLIDKKFRDKVLPVRGSIVYCSLITGVEHSGVYVGDEKIVHREGNGHLSIVSLEVFLARLNGRNIAKTIYVSCYGKNAAGSEEVAERALAAVLKPEHEGYHLLFKNCHHFSQYCLTGQEPKPLSFTFMSLKSTLKNVYEFNNWRVWDTSIC